MQTQMFWFDRDEQYQQIEIYSNIQSFIRVVIDTCSYQQMATNGKRFINLPVGILARTKFNRVSATFVCSIICSKCLRLSK